MLGDIIAYSVQDGRVIDFETQGAPVTNAYTPHTLEDHLYVLRGHAEQQRAAALHHLRWLVVRAEMDLGMTEEVDPAAEWGRYDPRQVLINRAKGEYTRTPVDMYALHCIATTRPSVTCPAFQHSHYFRPVLPWPVRRAA